MLKMSAVIRKSAIKSMKSNKALFLPFSLASIILFALEYIILSLTSNQYIIDRSPALGSILMIGVFFATLLIIIIVLYASSFIRKKLTQEFGLYSILGLEKKHVRRISLTQFVILLIINASFSILIGYLTGNFLFVLLNRLMKDTGAGFMDYPFDSSAAIVTLILMVATYSIIYFLSALKIQRLQSLDLMKDSRKGHGRVNNRWIILVICLVTLAAGYYIALTTKGVLDSLSMIFIAIFLVMIGTYTFFMAFLVFVLKMMQKNKPYYYQPTHFLSTSGMLQRISKNATSLASITILASGILMVLGMTLTTYRNMENAAEGSMPREYEVSFAPSQAYEKTTEEQLDLLQKFQSELQSTDLISNDLIETNALETVLIKEDHIYPLLELGQKQKVEQGENSFVVLGLKADYLARYPDDSIQEDQWVLASNLKDLSHWKKIYWKEGKARSVYIGKGEIIPPIIGVDALYLGLNSLEELQAMQRYLLDNPEAKLSTVSSLYFDLKEVQFENTVQKLADKRGFIIESKAIKKESLYQLNGGLLFIGLIVSSVLIIGMILMLYFKQVSEGHEDKKNYQIMKQVGLPIKLIKKTIRSQVLWVFFLPLIFALIHNLFASQIIFKVLGLLGVNNFNDYLISFTIVVLGFVLFYLIFYQLTSQAYYRIINQED
ncbi:FtsX-like permease family protein [Facklamia miroungae]|uniref:Putative ABC transport system permease protein/bacitracin transport system permease protein n=1 Tax=Facklamia miroungae TaxID=120956 RepID=A0A1G7QKC4_9LACT|nr:FtsX-like permease family protein [Facklamia miroungae]NKZ28972.1 FtsX-like permease family protein [Facklamia miroungae]SDF98925.1 putative ABC transport system permease protein/bacitracin transport system permease protein [Facklamia miroungae]